MFNRPLVLRQLPGYKWQVYKGFIYTFTRADNGKPYDVIIPTGFVTDLASIPRPLWWFISPAGRHSQACVVHDFMYDHAIISKPVADKAFHDGLIELGVPRWRAKLMYLAVKLFGKGAYR